MTFDVIATVSVPRGDPKLMRRMRFRYVVKAASADDARSAAGRQAKAYAKQNGGRLIYVRRPTLHVFQPGEQRG